MVFSTAIQSTAFQAEYKLSKCSTNNHHRVYHRAVERQSSSAEWPAFLEGGCSFWLSFFGPLSLAGTLEYAG